MEKDRIEMSQRERDRLKVMASVLSDAKTKSLREASISQKYRMCHPVAQAPTAASRPAGWALRIRFLAQYAVRTRVRGARCRCCMMRDCFALTVML